MRLAQSFAINVCNTIIFPQQPITGVASALENGQYSVIWDGMELPLVSGDFHLTKSNILLWLLFQCWNSKYLFSNISYIYLLETPVFPFFQTELSAERFLYQKNFRFQNLLPRPFVSSFLCCPINLFEKYFHCMFSKYFLLKKIRQNT